jgi:hypothetical protein
MVTRYDDAAAIAEQAAAGAPTERILERLAEFVGSKATIQAVFGEPIRQGDITVVPVARVRWGFGGGAGRSDGPPTAGSGSSGGGGVAADPVGYVEIGPSGATFRPLRGMYPSPGFLIAAGLSAALVLRGLARLVRR